MNILILFDSQFSNIKNIAEAIGAGFDSQDQVRVLAAAKVTTKDLQDIQILVVGSPTQGGGAIQPLPVFLERLSETALNSIAVAAFDTRFLEEKQNGALRLVITIIGYAAPRLAKQLKRKGGTLVVQPKGFIVEGKDRSLADGELKKAKNWAQRIEENTGK
ncbi:MAG: nitric oxide synthase [Candidatus Pacebacteria bacterium CG_4_10_14_0_8_um_filter_43_12]|nr:MAG: nitric oxide synthase [Candidatus Pacebacteria bacterium CG10_big_fil_rev_8_21_14_0_10_44_11]PIY79662.1 MAG: nitric oxide synthase [Candidatus Pacebacteria bacterium CG_4_10_14_0_8_um_filter_43_12]